MSSGRAARVVPWICLLLAVIGAATSLYLWWQTRLLRAAGAGAGLALCPESGVLSCEAVLTSKYSEWLGISLASAGFANYALLVLACAALGIAVLRADRVLIAGTWLVAWSLSLLGTLAGLWLILVQIFLIHKFCLLCDLTHACGFASFVLLSLARPAEVAALSKRIVGGFALATVLATVALMVGQIVYEPKVKPRRIVVTGSQPLQHIETYASAPASQCAPASQLTSQPAPAGALQVPALSASDYYKILDAVGRLVATIDLNQEIVLGDRKVERTVIEFMDFGCGQCKRMFTMLEQVLKEYPDWFRVVVMFYPGNRECNPFTRRTKRHVCEIAKAALAIHKHRPDLYLKAHRTFFRLQGMMTGGMAWQIVKNLAGIDDNTLNQWRADTLLATKIRRHCAIAKTLGVHGLPGLYASGKMVSGTPPTVERLKELLTEMVGPPPAAASRPTG